jgi:hypothetical protein
MAIRCYERFLRLPVPMVLITMWLAGCALLGLCTLFLFSTTLVLVQLAAGTI